MVRVDSDLVLRSVEVVPPDLEGFMNRQSFLIEGVVVDLRIVEFTGAEGDGMQAAGSGRVLTENHPNRKVRGVCLHRERAREVRVNENGCRDERVLELVKG